MFLFSPSVFLDVNRNQLGIVASEIILSADAKRKPFWSLPSINQEQL